MTDDNMRFKGVKEMENCTIITSTQAQHMGKYEINAQHDCFHYNSTHKFSHKNITAGGLHRVFWKFITSRQSLLPEISRRK
jgi:hypothetical protein